MAIVDPTRYLRSRIATPWGKVIPFAERVGSQRYTYQGSTHRLTREFQCLWKDRFDLIQALLGSAKIEEHHTLGPKITRHLPHAYRQYRRQDNQDSILYAMDIENIEGVGPTPFSADAKVIPEFARQLSRVDDEDIYIFAKVTMGYSSPTYKIVSNEEVVQKSVLHLNRQSENPEQGPLVLLPAGRSEHHRYVTKHRSADH